MGVAHLKRAAKEKNDEFYTLYEDIEREIINYKSDLIGKSIYCNCDDPLISEFWRFFHENFEKLQLKELIATHYTPGQKSYAMIYKGGADSNPFAGTVKQLQGDGDFRSAECVDILKRVDLVITNPPFSLYLVYIAQLIDYDKKFIIVSPRIKLGTRLVFDYLQTGKLKVGYNLFQDFKGPAGEPRSSACIWLTNIDVANCTHMLNLTKHYDPKEYKQYDNYEALNVDSLKDIPCDYYGILGVPITYLIYHNPAQFKLKGITNHNNYPFHNKIYINPLQHNVDGSTCYSSKINDDCVLRTDNVKDKLYYTCDNDDGKYVGLFKRVFIQRV